MKNTSLKTLMQYFPLAENQLVLFDKFMTLLLKWNKTYNLTAIREPDKIVTHHILDSLSINKYLEGNQIIDFGTGAGFPGLPLAIINPDKHFVLMDSVGKKVNFLNAAKLELGLTNIEPINIRAEDYQPDEKFDCLTTRAVGSVKDIVKLTQHLVKDDGKFLIMKGQDPRGELEEAGVAAEVIKLDTPFLEGERRLVIYTACPAAQPDDQAH